MKLKKTIAASMAALLAVSALLTGCGGSKTAQKKQTICTGPYGMVAAIRDNGTVALEGRGSLKNDVSGWSNIEYIECGENSVFGVRKDGTVLYAGENMYGEGDVFGWKDITMVSTGGVIPVYSNDNGGYFTVGVKKNGTVVATGNNDCGQLDVSGWKDIVKVATTAYNTIGLKKDGTVVVAGKYENEYYDGSEFDIDLSGWKDIEDISASLAHIIGLKKDGTIAIASARNPYYDGKGLNVPDMIEPTYDFFDDLPDVSNFTDIVAIPSGGIVAGLKKDGTIVEPKGSITYYDHWKDVAAISGKNGLVGLRKDGAVLLPNSGNYYPEQDWNDIRLP